MSEQDGRQAGVQQRPTTNDQSKWKAFWKAQGQHWRTEPEIDGERQKELDGRRKIVPDSKKGEYPFKGKKLSRADVEWLLATHDNGRGPIDWIDESQRERKGLDLRGADLCSVNLSGLPLTRMDGSINFTEECYQTNEQRAAAAVRLEGAKLINTHLDGATLDFASFKGTSLNYASLEEATIRYARLEGASLINVNLQGANLFMTHLEGANFLLANLSGTLLWETFLDSTTRLHRIVLGNKQFGEIYLADIHWGNVNVAVVDWSSISILGEERTALQQIDRDGEIKDRDLHLYEYQTAVRAYRQLAVILRDQGLNEDGARFAYRAQKLQRKVFWYQLKFGQYLFSQFLDLLAGYGYKPHRSFIAYLIVIFGFAISYYIIGQTVGPSLSPLGSFVFSMTSFHGRGFFPGGIGLDDPLTVLAALEAFVGLLIEVTFIATLTQRLFGK